MAHLERNEGGFHVLPLVLVLVVLGVVGFAGWKVMGRDGGPTSNSAGSSGPSELIWQQADGGWVSTQTPPACPDQPMMKFPAKLADVTSVLYPGQKRGGQYKPHGGFRFDNAANNNITVTAPLGGYVVRGGQYLEQGEVQYVFDVMNNCGVMYRFDHLAVLSDTFKEITKAWPAPAEGDSRTQQVSPAVAIKQGDLIATSVGFAKTKNTSFDWGVYDFRATNEASKSTAYQQAHTDDRELSWHAVCWFDWLSSSDEAAIRALPAGDQTSGKSSDYCK